MMLDAECHDVWRPTYQEVYIEDLADILSDNILIAQTNLMTNETNTIH